MKLEYDENELPKDIVSSYTIRRSYDVATGTWSVYVNGEPVLECLGEKEMEDNSDAEVIKWYNTDI